jgi:hypothetical protein
MCISDARFPGAGLHRGVEFVHDRIMRHRIFGAARGNWPVSIIWASARARPRGS